MDSGLRRVPDLGFSECIIGDGFVLTRFNKKRVPPLTCLHITHALLCSPRAKGCFFMQDLYLHPEVLKFFEDHFAPLLDQEGVYVFDDLLLVRDLSDEIRPEWTGVIDSQHDIQVLLGNCQGLLESADESLRVHCLVANVRLFTRPSL